MSGTEAAGTVARLLGGLRRRQRALNSLRWAVNGALVGAGAGCTTALIMWAAGHPALAQMLIVAALVTVALACLGALAGAMIPISDLALARALDSAGKGQDRFASALQLMGDTHVERARLVVEDAIQHVQGTSPAAALPMRMPRSIRWLPAPFVVLAILLLVLPQTNLQAAPPIAPEITPDQWKELADDFNKELAKLPKPLTAEEEDLQKELEKLAEKLKENPDKKDALKDIARLSDRVEKERRSISAKELSMKKAAKAISKSAALKQLAAKMKAGQYQDASEELKAVATKMQNGELSPDAEEFEAIAKDLEKLAKEVDADKELEEAAQNAAGAASKMNKKELAEALKRMAQQMKKNAGKYQRSDNLARSKSMLDELKRRMNQHRPGKEMVTTTMVRTRAMATATASRAAERADSRPAGAQWPSGMAADSPRPTKSARAK